MSNFIVNPDGTTEPVPDNRERLSEAWTKMRHRFKVVGILTHRTACSHQPQPDIVPTTGIRANTLGKLKADYPHLLLKHCANPNDPSDAEFMAMAVELEALAAELKLNAEYLRLLTERSPPFIMDEEKIEATLAAKRRILEKGLDFIERYGGDPKQAEDRIHRITTDEVARRSRIVFALDEKMEREGKPGPQTLEEKRVYLAAALREYDERRQCVRTDSGNSGQ